MKMRKFGKTELNVSMLGFGTAELGFQQVSQKECNTLLNQVIDTGINVIDTAACYQDAEIKIGCAIADRRKEYFLFSKCGHQVAPDDPPEWSSEIIVHSAQRSLKLLQTDHLDVLFLHSCSREVLFNDEVIQSIEKCRQMGFTRYIGYSGDGDDIILALEMGVFDCIETSVNICDQQVIGSGLVKAKDRDYGVIAKRPIANACWRNRNEIGEFYHSYATPYRKRLDQMGISPQSLGYSGSWVDLALRFTIFQPGVHTAIVGSRNINHVKENIESVELGPLPEEITKNLRETWLKNDNGTWKGQN
ncbi:MAG: aldo/keto reductase [Spirochaetota bacterium]|nr:MAG: aldo/keto reductase [Spirochaetota bacterium]